MDGQVPSWIRSAALARVAFSVWISFNAGLVASVYLPGPLGGGKLPWSMFATQTINSPRLLVAVESDGEWHDLPLTDFFHYARGATRFRIPDEYPLLKGPRDNEAKRAFARWMAERAEERGLQPTRVRLSRHLTHAETGEVQVVEVVTYRVDEL